MIDLGHSPQHAFTETYCSGCGVPESAGLGQHGLDCTVVHPAPPEAPAPKPTKARKPAPLSVSQHRLLASIRDHDGDVWEGWRIWASSRRVNPDGAESAFSAVMRKEYATYLGSNRYALTETGQKALDDAEKGTTR